MGLHSTLQSNFHQKLSIGSNNDLFFRKEEGAADIHPVPNIRIRKRISLQPLPYEKKKNRDRPRAVSNRKTD